MESFTKEKLLKDMTKLGPANAGLRGSAAHRTKHHMGHKPVNTSALKPFDLKDLKASSKKKTDEKKTDEKKTDELMKSI